MSGVPGPEWHWDGSEWWWWNGSDWVEAGVAPAAAPPPGTQGEGAPPTAPPEYHQSAQMAPQPATIVAGQPASAPRKGLGAGALTAIALGVVLLLVLVGGGIALYVVKSHEGAEPVAATESATADDVITLTTEPLNTANSPFTPPMGTDRSVTPVATQGVQTAPAETVGLYGGTMDNATCDKDQLVTFLQTNPDKAAAWAQALGITTSQIPQFVEPLTPVLLRSDTTVTNHGFENGKLTTVVSVLEAGTAVLVNLYGQPVVKCYCGNPLGPPPPMKQVRYVGPTWPAFQPGSLTIIQSSTTIINNFTLVNVENNTTFIRPAGTDGTQDQPSEVPAPADPIQTTPAPATPAPVVPDPVVPDPVAPTTQAPPPAVQEGGRESQAITLAQDALWQCAIEYGEADMSDFDAVLAGSSWSAEPTGQGSGLYWVTVVDEISAVFKFTVNVDLGTVTPADEAAADLATYCPGTYS